MKLSFPVLSNLLVFGQLASSSYSKNNDENLVQSVRKQYHTRLLTDEHITTAIAELRGKKMNDISVSDVVDQINSKNIKLLIADIVAMQGLDVSSLELLPNRLPNITGSPSVRRTPRPLPIFGYPIKSFGVEHLLDLANQLGLGKLEISMWRDKIDLFKLLFLKDGLGHDTLELPSEEIRSAYKFLLLNPVILKEDNIVDLRLQIDTALSTWPFQSCQTISSDDPSDSSDTNLAININFASQN